MPLSTSARNSFLGCGRKMSVCGGIAERLGTGREVCGPWRVQVIFHCSLVTCENTLSAQHMQHFLLLERPLFSDTELPHIVYPNEDRFKSQEQSEIVGTRKNSRGNTNDLHTILDHSRHTASKDNQRRTMPMLSGVLYNHTEKIVLEFYTRGLTSTVTNPESLVKTSLTRTIWTLLNNSGAMTVTIPRVRS